MAHVHKDFQFVCPTCGGNFFGTFGYAANGDWSQAQGHCNGDDDARECRFTWPRSEDWKYFHLVTSVSFDSHEAYENARNGIEEFNVPIQLN